MKQWEVTNGARITVAIMPHDARHKTVATKFSCEEVARNAGYRVDIVSAPSKVSRMDGINMARAFFAICHIDKLRCKRGLECVQHYQSSYDETKHKFIDEPLHDWSSHGADSWRYLAVWYYEYNNSNKVDANYVAPKQYTYTNGYGRI